MHRSNLEIDAIRLYGDPVNIGSEEMVTINQLVETAKVANKKVEKQHILDAPLGVRGRNSNNDLVREKLGWDYSQTLEEGIRKTYNWICLQLYTQQKKMCYNQNKN